MGTINYAELQQDILNTLVKQVTPVNFKNLAYPEAKLLQNSLPDAPLTAMWRRAFRRNC